MVGENPGNEVASLKVAKLPETWYKRKGNENAKGWHKGCHATVQQKNEKNNDKWNNKGLASFLFCSYVFAPSPRSESLEHANMGEWVSRRSRGVLVSAAPSPQPLWEKSHSFRLQKRQRKLINKTFSLKFTVWTLTLLKIFSNPSKCLFGQRFLHEPIFFIDNLICPSRYTHFVGLSSPTLIVHPKEKVFLF